MYAAPINAPIRRLGAAAQQTSYAAPFRQTQATHVTSPAPAQTIYRPGGPMPPITTTTTTTAAPLGASARIPAAPQRVSPWDSGRPAPAQSVHRPETYRPETYHRPGAAPAQDTSSPVPGGQPQADATLRAVFERFDANRSGRLDYSELRNCLHALGIDVTPPEAAQVLARYDADHSGLMELDEFARLSHSLGYQPA